MNGTVGVPDILNALALAGKSGVAVPGEPGVLRDLDLCRTWGFDIRPGPEGRMVLAEDEDSLVPAWIERESRPVAWNRLAVVGFFRAASTNDEAAALARSGSPAGLVVYAEEQMAGRGRKGRRWHSPPRAGLYFSLVVRPCQPVACWPILTHAAAVALFETLSGTGAPLAIDLKWPNDLLLSGRKAAGILLETAGFPKTSAAVVGVGINVARESVPDELRETATSIAAEAGVVFPRRQLMVGFLDRFQALYELFERGEHPKVLARWKEYSSMWNGSPVTIADGESRRPGITCGLTDMGALRVRLEGGSEETILSGDVTLRRGTGN